MCYFLDFVQNDSKNFNALEKLLNTNIVGKKKKPEDLNPTLSTDEGVTIETRKSIKVESAFQDYNLQESPHNYNFIGTGKPQAILEKRRSRTNQKADALQSLLLRRGSLPEEKTSKELKISNYSKELTETYEQKRYHRSPTPPQRRANKILM
jgi:hypothetical protein